MNIAFLDLVNTSISASWLVAVVIVLRLLLKRAPKAIHCALWALVAVRLLCPITIESQFSLIPSAETISDYYLTQEAATNTGSAVLDVVENPVYPENVDIPLHTESTRMEWMNFEWTAFFWPAGMTAMALYALVSWLRLRKKVSASIPIAQDIRLCDYIDSPFILGVLRPVIYLPSNLDQGSVDHVLAHERAHLSRRDHWWKPLGFGLLTIHWFNPVMWLAYILLCRDIELACDEKVIKNLGDSQKKSYSAALLRCSVSRGMIAACPLAFGEVGVKERVKSVLNYKKPAFWIVVIAVIVCVVVAVCFLTDPMSVTVGDIVESNDYTILAQCEQYLCLQIPSAQLPDSIFSEEGHTFREKEVIVAQTDTSTIWLRSAQYANEGSEQMYFEFDISYDLPKVGTILLPYGVDLGNGYQTDWRVADGYTDESGNKLVSVRGAGPGCRFTAYLDTNFVETNMIFSHLNFEVYLNQLTYAKAGMEPELNRGVYSSAVAQDKSFQQSGNEVYEIGWDSRQREVFLDPYRAFEQFTQDYAEAITYIQQANGLSPIDPLDYYPYLVSGWQTTPPDETLRLQCEAVSDFLDIYDNNMTPVNDSEDSCNGTYKAGNLLAQHGLLSSGYGTGNLIFHLNDYHLSVYDLMGEELFSSNRIVISNPTREEVFETVHYRVVVWKENGNIMQEVTADFIPEDTDIELWQFYTDGTAQAPEYTLFFFDGELKWFAKNYYHSYEQIWEVAIPMDEDEIVPSGTYVSEEKVYWALHSSLYVEGLTMEVNSNAISLAFQGIDVGGASIYPLDADWQKECPISEERRETLAELSNIESAFALSDLSDCKFLVMDATHFLVEKDGELYVVAWRDSEIHLEMIDYIFHVVPETESVTIPLGTATLEADALEKALRDEILNYNLSFLEIDQTATISCESSYDAWLAETDEGFHRAKELTVRLGYYQKNEDGSIAETSSGYHTVYLEYLESPDGTTEITDYRQEPLTEIPGSAFTLEAECWRQAFVHFDPDTEAATAELITEYPEYFTRDTTYGLDLLWWDSPEGVRCVILSGLQRQRSGSEAGNHPHLTVPEAMMVLQSYDIPVTAIFTAPSSTLAIYHVEAP